VYGIVKQSGGHIWLYSELGLGTSFKLYFPVAERTAPPRTVEPPSENLNGTETVLVVEDADLVRTLVKTMLEDYGYTVLTAPSGGEALALAASVNGEFQLVITDVVMRGMNGRELAEELIGRYPRMKILFTSGYPADTVIRHGIADASAAFIEKPYLPSELARKVREVLDARD
jgi:two-component system cell cycle sensor histidine kinase/response regulator CckA